MILRTYLRGEPKSLHRYDFPDSSIVVPCPPSNRGDLEAVRLAGTSATRSRSPCERSGERGAVVTVRPFRLVRGRIEERKGWLRAAPWPGRGRHQRGQQAPGASSRLLVVVGGCSVPGCSCGWPAVPPKKRVPVPDGLTPATWSPEPKAAESKRQRGSHGVQRTRTGYEPTPARGTYRGRPPGCSKGPFNRWYLTPGHTNPTLSFLRPHIREKKGQLGTPDLHNLHT